MTCLVTDPFNITEDTKMPFLGEVISPSQVQATFRDYLSFLDQKTALIQIKVLRYKPQRRCLIEYTFQGNYPFTFLGKIRAKGTDWKTYELQKQLWSQGFDDYSKDSISVPKPLGIIPQWQMWLQEKVPGQIITSWLTTPQGNTICQTVAHIAHKLHQANIPCYRRHTITDELQILEAKLPQLLSDYPHWELRLQRLLEKCQHLGETIPEFPVCGIHRDFYFDQIILERDRFYLLDLDLYCAGNPNLDIGNFIAHITEYSLRKFGNFNALRDRELALEQEFIKLTEANNRVVINAYKTLTLVRHIYLSHQFLERRPYTETLLNLCEQCLQSINI